MDKIQYVKLEDIYKNAKVDWDAIHYRNGSSESEDLEHWAAFHGKKLLDAVDEVLKGGIDITVAVGTLNSRGIFAESTLPFTAE